MKTKLTNWDIAQKEFYNLVRERKEEVEDIMRHLDSNYECFKLWYMQEWDWRFLRDILGGQHKGGMPWDYNTLIHLPKLNGITLKGDLNLANYLADNFVGENGIKVIPGNDPSVNDGERAILKIRIDTENPSEQQTYGYLKFEKDPETGEINYSWSQVEGVTDVVTFNEEDKGLYYDEAQHEILELNRFYNKDQVDAKVTIINNEINGLHDTDDNLQEQITRLANLGKFLTQWDCSTGLQVTDPYPLPYTYASGDFYIVSKIADEGEDNLIPNGETYTGDASTTVSEETIHVGDFFIYDGEGNWMLQKSGDVSINFSQIAGEPTDNVKLNQTLTNINNEIASKQDANVLQSFIGMIIQGDEHINTLAQVQEIYGQNTVWEKIQGKFLLGTDSGHAIGTTGGTETVTLTTNEIPSHNHGNKSLNGWFETREINHNTLIRGTGGIMSDAKTGDVQSTVSESGDRFSTVRVSVDASHTHDSVGGGQAHNNMPPYLVINIWKRTA